MLCTYMLCLRKEWLVVCAQPNSKRSLTRRSLQPLFVQVTTLTGYSCHSLLHSNAWVLLDVVFFLLFSITCTNINSGEFSTNFVLY